MRIAFVSFSTVPFGSNDLLWYKAALSALDRGHELLVSPYDRKLLNAAEYDHMARVGAAVHYRNAYRRHPAFWMRQWQKICYHWRDPLDNFSFLEQFRPDVIAVCDPATYHFVSASGCADFLLRTRIPFVTVSQFNDENTALCSDTFEKARLLFSKAAKCVFVSRRNLETARRQMCIPLHQAIVLDNPPNLVRMDAEPFPESPVARMAAVARLECGVKGQALMLEILARPEWLARDWTLDICGQGPDEQYLRELVAFYRLRERIYFRGHCEVRQVWQKNMILLMCSSGEGKPLALIEALVCGRPAVVTDVGGNAEIVEDGVNGFVAESATVAGFAAAMERAWSRRKEWESLGSRGRKIMLERLIPPPEERFLDVLTDEDYYAASRERP